ncbi:MAG TPA: PAS domain S-box protein, partial [Rhodospirillales bacterium]|nr:PAS domain S-box protein [Rhodospirillales bacterium]
DRRNEIGEMARAVEIFRNTAIDRARADQALQESGERLGAVVDHIFDGIFIIDELGTIQSINPAGSGMFGYGQEDIIGSNINVLMPTPHQSAHDVYLSDYVKTGKSSIIGVGREFEGLRRNGTTFPLHLQIADLNLGTGRFFLGVVRDLTEQKEADRAKDEFVSTVSHELRTPLTSIKGSLGLIRSGSIGELPDKLRTMLDIAYNNSDRLVLLINDILDMEKIKAGKMDYTMKPLNVTSLIDEAITANKGYGDEHNITFVSHSDISGAVIDADKGRMMQVMTNLMSNAAKFSPDGETVKLAALRRGSMIRISVIDKGPGIADDFKKTIFQQFSQADSSDTRKKGGTGLGLSITRAIVQQHKGSIGFETELGEGSTFFIDIPELLEARKTDDDLDGETGGNDRYRILHIEDDESVLQVVAAVLGDSAHIVTARTIAEGTRLLEQGVFDLLILDLTLPDGDGESLILLLEQPGQPSTPVIIFSAKDVPRDISSKVTAVLLKSQTSNDALFDTVRSALGVEIAGK